MGICASKHTFVAQEIVTGHTQEAPPDATVLHEDEPPSGVRTQRAVPVIGGVVSVEALPWAGLAGVSGWGADIWGSVHKLCARTAAVIDAKVVSVCIISSSRLSGKPIVYVRGGPDRPSLDEFVDMAALPTAVHVARSMAPVFFQAPTSEGPPPGATDASRLPEDCLDLHRDEGCTSFAILPLVVGCRAVGVLTVADPKPDIAWPVPWMAALCSWVSSMMMQLRAVAAVDLVERLSSAPTLRSLAWLITGELPGWFEWSQPQATEARLVLLSEDQANCLVLSRRAAHAVGSLDRRSGDGGPPLASSAPARDASGPGEGHVWEAGEAPRPFLGPAVPLASPSSGSSGASSVIPQTTAPVQPTTPDAALTSAAALPGSPAVPSPATPPNLPHLGSPVQEAGLLLGTGMATANTLVARGLADGNKMLLVTDVMSALKKYGQPWKDVFLEQGAVSNPCWVIAAPVLVDHKPIAAVLWLSSSRLNMELLAESARLSVPSLVGSLAKCFSRHLINMPLGTVGLPPAAPALPATGPTPLAGLEAWQDLLSQPQPDPVPAAHPAAGEVGRGILSDPYMQSVRFVMAHGDLASTGTLMRLYEHAITHNQPRASPDAGADTPQLYEEVEIISKVGQGAFGSVYMAVWRRSVVAVKVMRQHADGRRTMRTAWELAVTKNLNHANVVNVLAVYTDMAVEKRSKRVIRFASWTAQQQDILATPLIPDSSGARCASGLPRCQVIIMEYCNMGPLHLHMAERRKARGRQQQPHELRQLGGWSGGSGLYHVSDGSGPRRTVPGAGDGAGAWPAPLGAVPEPAPEPQMRPDHQPEPALHGAMLDALGSSAAPPPTEAVGPLGDTIAPLQDNNHTDYLLEDLTVVLPTLLEVAQAMAYLHTNGLVHLDLKPENVLLKASTHNAHGFTAKVSDFGMSELFTLDGPVMGGLGGTVTHIAPEAVLHRKVSMACDVYSFGIMMWELLTGRRPYRELLETALEKKQRDKLILSQVVHKLMRPVFPPGSPLDYTRLAERCWAAEPEQRPTFQVVMAELRRMMEALDMGGLASTPSPTAAEASLAAPNSATHGASV